MKPTKFLIVVAPSARLGLASAEVTYENPVIPGNHPDPSSIRGVPLAVAVATADQADCIFSSPGRTSI